MRIRLVLAVAAIALVGTAAVMLRYDLRQDGYSVYVLDRWTGHVTYCRQGMCEAIR